MPDSSLDMFNAIANAANVLGVVVTLYVLIKMRRISERLELAIAPRVGIESHLQMCAQVVECDPDGTCIVDDDGRIVLVNKSMEDITGYHRSELVGQLVEMLVPDQYRSAHPRHREGFVTGPSSRPMRGVKLKHKRGRELTVGINLNHYRDSSGGYTIAKIRIPDDEWARRSSGEMPRMSE